MYIWWYFAGCICYAIGFWLHGNKIAFGFQVGFAIFFALALIGKYWE